MANDVKIPVESSTDPVPPVVDPVPPVEPPAKPGEKTDPALLLSSLQEEREKRRLAEAKLKELEDAVASGDTVSAEGKVLKTQIEEMKGTIASMTRSNQITALHTQFPVLKDKQSEFDAYVSDPKNAGMSLETAAKSFLVDNNLLEVAPARKGLEKPSGGGRNPTPQGYTFASIEEIRKNNFRQYTKLLKEDAFKDVTE